MNKTEYLVADNKIEALEQHLATDSVKRLILIEDSLSNIEKAKNLTQQSQVAFTPVWTLYSRGAMELKRSNPLRYDNLMQSNNGIHHFYEIENIPNLEGADLVIDFDGVIGDHIRMRNLQAQVKWRAIENARKKMIK